MTTVIFRKYKDTGDILALFPGLPCHYHHWKREIMCYEHVGQHGSADYTACIAMTRPATAEEYEPLYRELTRIGYRLNVKQRRGPSDFRDFDAARHHMFVTRNR